MTNFSEQHLCDKF